MSAAQQALKMCAQTVIPSLFPFFVLSGLLIHTGFIQVAGAVISPIIRPLLRVSGSGALAFVIGIVSGYPTGAKMIADLYRKKLIDRTEARRLLPFCNNSGPLFIIGAVGSGMLGSVKVGIFLYLVHFLAALLVGLCFRFYGVGTISKSVSVKSAVGSKLREYYQSQRSGLAISESVSSAVNTTLLICGFIVLFSAFTSCLEPMLTLIKSETIQLFLKGFFEVTAGVKNLCTSPLLLSQKLIIISALMGFGGICVHFQVVGMLSGTDLGLKTYLIGKLLHTVFAAMICAFLFHFLPTDSVTAWNPGGVAEENSISLWQIVLSGMAVTFFLAKQLSRRLK